MTSSPEPSSPPIATGVLVMTRLISPLDLLVNTRTKHSHWIKPEVRAAMKSIEELFLVGAEVVSWHPPRNSLYRADCQLWFPSLRGDIDGPVKRLIDAAFKGLRRYCDETWVHDGRLVSLHVEKYIDRAMPGLALRISYLSQ